MSLEKKTYCFLLIHKRTLALLARLKAFVSVMSSSTQFLMEVPLNVAQPLTDGFDVTGPCQFSFHDVPLS